MSTKPHAVAPLTIPDRDIWINVTLNGPGLRLWHDAQVADRRDYELMRRAQTDKAVMSWASSIHPWVHQRGLPDRSAQREADRRFGQPHYGH